MPDTATHLLDYWFADCGEDPARATERFALWFQPTADQDAEMCERFGASVEAALAGRLDAWASEPQARLAQVLLLDQLARNFYRGTAKAFSGDSAALALALAAADADDLGALHVPGRLFMLLPFEHAEDLAMQHRAVAGVERLLTDAGPGWRDFLAHSLEATREHRDIIEQFGRFPHRNDVLGRETTAAERAYLDGGAKRFGQ